MVRATPKIQFILLALLAACAGGSLPSNGSHALSPAVVRPRPTLPPSLLYVAGGPTSEPYPFIEVFNAGDASPSPTPIYTIAPIGGGSYGFLAVDGANELFAVNYFTNGAKLVIFPSGRTKPKVSCLLDTVPQGIYVAHGTLYLTTASSTIEEYSLPISPGQNCPAPNTVLTDQRAKLRSKSGLWGIAVDPSGNIFDQWYDANINQRFDEFAAGSNNAHRFASLGMIGAVYMTSDLSGSLITTAFYSGRSGQSDYIAVFPHGSKDPRLFEKIPNGAHLGVAVGLHGRELFAAVDYPTTQVQVFAYNANTGRVGRLLRSFGDVWYYAQDIAVFAGK